MIQTFPAILGFSVHNSDISKPLAHTLYTLWAICLPQPHTERSPNQPDTVQSTRVHGFYATKQTMTKERAGSFSETNVSDAASCDKATRHQPASWTHASTCVRDDGDACTSSGRGKHFVNFCLCFTL